MAHFDECDQPENIKSQLKEFAEKRCGFLLLAGKNGTGKSFAAQCVVNACEIRDSDHRIFITQSDLNLKWMKHVKSDDPNAVDYLLNQIRNCIILVIDDLGTRTPTEAFMDFLYAIIDFRWRKQACTIITTNLNSKDYREKFGDAFTSRSASGLVFRFEGNDRRFKDF